MASIRAEIETTFKDETKDIRVTFALIDKVSQFVDWSNILINIENGRIPPLTDTAKFIFYNLKFTGFNVNDDDLETIYDELVDDDSQTSYINLTAILLEAYAPRGKKKTVEKSTRKKKAS